MHKIIKFDKLHAHQFISVRKIIAKNFLGGIAWGVGSVIGATVIISVLAATLGFFHYVPFFGSIVDQVQTELQEGPKRIIK